MLYANPRLTSYLPSQAFVLLKYSDVDAVTGLPSVFHKAGRVRLCPTFKYIVLLSK